MLLVSCHFPFKHPPKGDQGTPYCKKGYPRPHVAGEIAVCCSVSFVTFLLHWGSRTPTLPSGQLAKKKKSCRPSSPQLLELVPADDAVADASIETWAVKRLQTQSAAAKCGSKACAKMVAWLPVPKGSMARPNSTK